jgi:hypothetical protein
MDTPSTICSIIPLCWLQGMAVRYHAGSGEKKDTRSLLFLCRRFEMELLSHSSGVNEKGKGRYSLDDS